MKNTSTRLCLLDMLAHLLKGIGVAAQTNLSSTTSINMPKWMGKSQVAIQLNDGAGMGGNRKHPSTRKILKVYLDNDLK